MDSYNYQSLGKEAEQRACRYLQAQGLQLLEQNYHSRFGEIDLIMQDKDHIVFVEVRLRSRQDYGSALESVNKTKIRKVIKTATHFLQGKNWLHQVNSRFDIVAIQYQACDMQFNWIKNAFWPSSV